MESDLRDIEEIYEKSNDALSLDVPAGFFSKDKTHFSSYTVSHCRNKVFEENGSVLGVISYSNDYIEGLFVLPECWGRGIGSALLESAAEDEKELRLQVYAGNGRALGFYKKHGFKVVGSGRCQMTGLDYFEMEKTE